MSKRFKRQDYFRFKKLGTKWRRAKGHQSKMRKKKGGAGFMPSVGYMTNKLQRNKINGESFSVLRNPNDIEKIKGAIIIGAGLGAKKINSLMDKLKNFKVLNMKSIKRSKKIAEKIKK